MQALSGIIGNEPDYSKRIECPFCRSSSSNHILNFSLLYQIYNPISLKYFNKSKIPYYYVRRDFLECLVDNSMEYNQQNSLSSKKINDTPLITYYNPLSVESKESSQYIFNMLFGYSNFFEISG